MALKEGKKFRLKLDGRFLQDEISYDMQSSGDTTTATSKDGDYILSVSKAKTISCEAYYNDSPLNDAGGDYVTMEEIEDWHEADTDLAFEIGSTEVGGRYRTGTVKITSFNETSNATDDAVRYTFDIGVQGALTRLTQTT